MNVYTATGNLGRDASTNNVNGTAVANFVVAVKSGFGDNEQTVWVDCALWGKRAEGGLIQYLTKGQQVAISGELGTREYQAQDGSMRTVVTCRLHDVTLLGGKSESNGGGQQQPRQQTQQQPQRQAPQQQPSGVDDFSDDVPF